MCSFLLDLAKDEHAEWGDEFALRCKFRVMAQVPLERRIETCSRAVDILNAQHTMFEWRWVADDGRRVIVSARVRDTFPSIQELR